VKGLLYLFSIAVRGFFSGKKETDES
jgi:hypothetical protein